MENKLEIVSIKKGFFIDESRPDVFLLDWDDKSIEKFQLSSEVKDVKWKKDEIATLLNDILFSAKTEDEKRIISIYMKIFSNQKKILERDIVYISEDKFVCMIIQALRTVFVKYVYQYSQKQFGNPKLYRPENRVLIDFDNSNKVQIYTEKDFVNIYTIKCLFVMLIPLIHHYDFLCSKHSELPSKRIRQIYAKVVDMLFVVVDKSIVNSDCLDTYGNIRSYIWRKYCYSKHENGIQKVKVDTEFDREVFEQSFVYNLLNLKPEMSIWSYLESIIKDKAVTQKDALLEIIKERKE
jgi:hypothetical protein